MTSPYDDGWPLIHDEDAGRTLDALAMEIRANDPRTHTMQVEPTRNPFTGQNDGTQVLTFFNPDGDCVGGGVAIPYKRKQKE